MCVLVYGGRHCCVLFAVARLVAAALGQHGVAQIAANVASRAAVGGVGCKRARPAAVGRPQLSACDPLSAKVTLVDSGPSSTQRRAQRRVRFLTLKC